jgi:hypothetical protein
MIVGSTPRIVVAVPARDEVKTLFAFDLVNLVAQHIINTGHVVIPMPSMGTMVHSQRTALVQEAQKERATHILFLDSDMRVPADTISRMLAHKLPVVAANCARRRMPTGPTASNYTTNGPVEVLTLPDSPKVEKVDAVGTGVMLIEMEVFDKLKAPWFASPWVPAQNNFMGEDVYFCMQLQRAGIPVHIDNELSLEVGHIGDFEFRHPHTWVIREQLEQQRLLEAECHSQVTVS